MICSKLLDRTGGGGFALVSDWTASCTPESIRIKWDWCWGAWLDATGLNRRRAQFSQSSAATNRLIVKEFFIEGELPTYEVMVQTRQSKLQIDDKNWRWLIYDDLLIIEDKDTSTCTLILLPYSEKAAAMSVPSVLVNIWRDSAIDRRKNSRPACLPEDSILSHVSKS